MDLKSAIRGSYIAQGLNEAQLEKLFAIAEIRNFADGEPLMTQDDEERDLFVVVDGRARILSITGETIGMVTPGMPIGEISFIDGRPRSVSVIGDGPCEAVVLPAEPLWKLMRENKDIATTALLNVARVLCARLRSANRNLATLMALDELETPSNAR